MHNSDYGGVISTIDGDILIDRVNIDDRDFDPYGMPNIYRLSVIISDNKSKELAYKHFRVSFDSDPYYQKFDFVFAGTKFFGAFLVSMSEFKVPQDFNNPADEDEMLEVIMSADSINRGFAPEVMETGMERLVRELREKVKNFSLFSSARILF